MIFFSLAVGYLITGLFQGITAIVRTSISLGDKRLEAFASEKITLAEDFELATDKRPGRTLKQFLGNWPENVKAIFNRNAEISASVLGFALPLVPLVSAGLITGPWILVATLAAFLVGGSIGLALARSNGAVPTVWVFGAVSFTLTVLSLAASITCFVLAGLFP